MDLVIDSLGGWASQTRVYSASEWRETDAGREADGWIIQCMDTALAVERMIRAIPEGVPKPDVSSAVHPGPTSIFRARITQDRSMEWVADDDTSGTPPMDGGEVTVESTGTTRTILIDGERWGGMHTEPIWLPMTAVAIDSDGDPLNGLTPQFQLPAGTTFDQALAHITEQEQ